VNQALRLLQSDLPATKAARQLARAHDISMRQAHRYVALAKNLAVPVDVPEPKAVFTVKLPRRLIARVRRAARQDGGSGEWVAAALHNALSTQSAHG